MILAEYIEIALTDPMQRLPSLPLALPSRNQGCSPARHLHQLSTCSSSLAPYGIYSRISYSSYIQLARE